MNKILRFLMPGIVALSVVPCFAVPAKRGVREWTLPDGSSVKVQRVGDEFFHQYYSEDGYPLILEDGYFYYCDVDQQGEVTDSRIRATNRDCRSAEAINYLSKINLADLELRIARAAERKKLQTGRTGERKASSPRKAAADQLSGSPFEKGPGLFPDSRFPAYGRQKALVILVEYKDVKFKNVYGDVNDFFSRMLNEDGFSDYGATGSASQYFKDNSMGCFIPEFDVYGPVTLKNGMAYYGGNDKYGDDMFAEQMVVEACKLLDNKIDFKDYDRDNDGIVDNVYIFYAGGGEATCSDPNTVWPHSWSLDEAQVGQLYLDGVRINTYACSNEWDYDLYKPDGIGTFVHEFSHVLGLPDLYNTGYGSTFTPDEWSVLDYGPYNNDSRTPPNYGAYERYALGWIDPYVIDRPLSASLIPIDNNVCGLIKTEKETEFFLLENRQQTGWDTYIPGHGMLIWHIDYIETKWKFNQVNNTPGHLCVDIVEADNVESERTRDADSFPGTKNITSFTPETKPAFVSWDNEPINYPITDITETEGIITFNVLGGGEDWSSGIDNATIDSFENDETVVYYDLTGARVVSPVSGLYIRKQGEKVSKILIRP